MWQHQHVLDHDIFSYPYFGARWINHQWLWQVLTYLVYEAGGPNGLIFSRAAILLVALAVLWRLCREQVRASFLITCGVLIVGLFAMSERILERAHLISLFFNVVTLAVLESWTVNKNHRWLLVLVPLQIAWANLHGGFVLGPMLVFCAWAGAAWNEKRKRFLLLGMTTSLLLGAVSCANPFGWDLFGFVKAQTTSDIVQTTVVEWLKPFSPGPGTGSWERWFYGSYLSLFLCACAAYSVRWDAKRLFWAALGVLMFLSARRYADAMVFLAAPFITDNLTKVFSGVASRRPDVARAGRWIFCVMALTSAAWVGSSRLAIAEKSVGRFGLGVCKLAYPLEAADFIESHHLQANLFSQYNCGSFLAYRFFGKYPVFIDGRNLVYSEAFLQNYYRLFQSSGFFNQTVQRYGIQTILLLHALDGGRGFTQRLLADKQWKLVLLDSVASVFAKDIPEHKDIPDIRPLDVRNYLVSEKEVGYPVGKLLLADFFYRVGDKDGALKILDRIFQEYPNNADAHCLMGFLDKDQKDERAALVQWEAAARLDPCSWSVQFQLGLSYDRMGKARLARIAYQNALFLNPGDPAILNNMAILECKEGRWDRAKSVCGRLAISR